MALENKVKKCEWRIHTETQMEMFHKKKITNLIGTKKGLIVYDKCNTCKGYDKKCKHYKPTEYKLQ